MPLFSSSAVDLRNCENDHSSTYTGSFCCFGLRTRVSNDLVGPVQFGKGLYASVEPPFYIDQWWQEQLGKIESREVTGCSLFLLAQAEDPSIAVPDLSSRLNSHYFSLLLLGVGYSRSGVLLGGENTIQGRRVNTIGTVAEYVEPHKVIASGVNREHLTATNALARGIDALFQEHHKNDYLRLRKGFNALLGGIKQAEIHNRLHQFVRAIEAVIRPKQGDGTKKFKYRCQFFAGRKAEDVELLGELYELRSAAEHLNPMSEKLTAYGPGEHNNIKALRTFQSEQLASFIYRKILLDPKLLDAFVSESTISSLWLQNTSDLIKLWGDTLDLKKSHEGLFFDYLGE